MALALMLTILAGCDSSGGRLKITPERLYAEALIVPASQLNPGWRELGRQVMAHSVYGKTEHEQAGNAELLTFFAGDARKAIKPKGPCSVIAGIAYGRSPADAANPDETTESANPEVLLTALYLCRQYHALPLKNTDKLPHVPVKKWELGNDGLAMAEGAQSQPEAEIEDAGTDADKPARAAPKAKPEADPEPAKTAAKPKQEKGKATEPAGPDNADAKDEPEVDDEPPAPAKPEKPHPVNNDTPGSIIYLAANGLLVKICAAAAATDPDVQQAVTAIRKRLAESVAVEQEKHQELISTTGKHREKVKVEQFWNPNADVYWRLLDFAIGGTILKKKY